MARWWQGHVRSGTSIFPRRWLVLAFTLMASVLLMGAAARAAAQSRAYDTGYAITLALANGPTFVYGQAPTPIFRGTLTVPSGVSPTSVDLTVNFDGIPYTGPALTPINATTYSYSIQTDWSRLTAGTLTATAYYGNLAQSTPFTVTVNRHPTTLQCQLEAPGYVVGPGQTMAVAAA